MTTLSKIKTPWPNVTVYAEFAGLIDPYDLERSNCFRGEEAFEASVTGWKRWSKPSPEPQFDRGFGKLLLGSIAAQAENIAGLIDSLATQIIAGSTKAPVLVGVLRAGLPISYLLSKELERRNPSQKVPVVAISLFQGLGWDEQALLEVCNDYPDRTLWFIDGWTSGGGVAGELKASYKRWLEKGHPQLDEKDGMPLFGVLCDPRGFATAAATRQDVFIPSSCFTAPETLGFSRGFAVDPTSMLRVYSFPEDYIRMDYLRAWNATRYANVGPLPSAPDVEAAMPEKGWRLHINEVVRALVNRDPKEVWLAVSQEQAERELAPVLYMCKSRNIPVSFDRNEVASWGSLAAARMV
jgi:hypothetical protein